MGHLYLVRHGQASFGEKDYDQLSPMGQQQSVRLGQYWQGKGLRFDAVLTGTLKRHTQTYAGICEGLHGAADAGATPLLWQGLNEFDSLAQWLIADALAPTRYTATQGTCLGRAGQVHIEQDDGPS